MDKKCSKCKKNKFFNEFDNDKSRKDGLYPQCKTCKNESDRKHYKENKNEKLEKNKNWRKKNPEYNILYYEKNKKEIIKKVYNYKKEKYKTDPVFKTIRNLRNRIYNVLKNNYKSAKTMELLGCTTKFLKSYLEFRFTNGMTWENYGQWHIDHIIPCSLFDLSKEEQQRKCFHYTNLQPLWAKDNILKSNKST